MKQKLLALAFAGLSFAAYGQYPNCSGPGIGFSMCGMVSSPYVDGGAVFTIDRYLAKSMSMYDLSARAAPNPAGPNYTSDIQVAQNLGATFLRRVANVYGHETNHIPGAPGHTAAANAINDINNAYDCAGVPRPIVQAGLYEHFSSDVANVDIPDCVLETFSIHEPVEFGMAGLHWPVPPGTFQFDFNQMKKPGASSWTVSGPPVMTYTTIDITSIHSRMWFYYMATQFIDMGYLGLHMGWISEYTSNDFQYTNTGKLFDMIRQYARSKNTWVVLDAHTNVDLYVGPPPNKILLLDFLSNPYRPDELDPFLNANGAMTTLGGTPCQNKFNAELDMMMHFSTWMTNGGGHPPMAVEQGTGYTYDRTPNMFEMDWHNGVITSTPTSPSLHNGYQPWRTDEIRWYTALTDNCRQYWVHNNVCAVKNNITYRGYFQMPHLELDWSTGQANSFMRSGTQLYNRVLNETWDASTNLHFTVKRDCFDKNCDGQSDRYYVCDISDPDCSSVYQWHVKKPNGTWLPVTYGVTRRIKAADLGGTGNFIVYCNQINNGIAGTARTLEKQTYHDGGITCPDNNTPPSEQGILANGNNNNNVQNANAILTAEKYFETQKKGVKTANDVAPATNKVVSVYPNPANTSVNIALNLAAKDNISIYLFDMTGKKIMTIAENQKMTEGKHTLSHDLTGLAAGMYAIVTKTNGKTITESLVIHK